MCSRPSSTRQHCESTPLLGLVVRAETARITQAATRIVDLSHRVTNGMRVYPGVPAPSITAFLTHEQSRSRYDGQCELTFSQVNVVAGVGTYLDSPYHRDAALPDFASLPLDHVADVPGLVIDVRARPQRAITPADLGELDGHGQALVLRTGMDAYWETDRYWDDSPYLVEETAQRLIEARISMLVVDFLNVDDTRDPRRPAHTSLLRAQIPIVENACNLDRLPPTGFRVHAAPAAFEGVASFPIRAYAVVG